MTQRISDRLLEKARLGELTEEEMVDLVERLEAEEGGTQRLDALIDADDTFLREHPSELVVPMIRNRLERRVRDRDRQPEPEGAPMLSLSRMTRSPALTIAVASLAVLVAGVIAYFAAPRSEPPVVADSETSRPDSAVTVEEQRAQLAALAKAVNKATTAAASRSSNWERTDGFGEPSRTLELEVGETVEYPAVGLTRVELSQSKVASAAPNDTDTAIVITATAPGETSVLLVREDGEETIKLVVRADDFVPFADRLDRAMSPNNELIMEPGEKITFDAANVQRIEIDEVALLDVRHDELREEFTLRARDVGLTGMRVEMKQPDMVTPIYVRIVEPFASQLDIASGASIEANQALFRVPEGLEIDCEDETFGALGMSRWESAQFDPSKLEEGEEVLLVRVITTPSGAVSSAQAEFSSLDGNDLEECVLRAVRNFGFAPANGPRTALFGYRFPAPGDDSHESYLDEADIDEDTFRDVHRKAFEALLRGKTKEAIALCKPYAKAKPRCARTVATGYKDLGALGEACRWYEVAGAKIEECSERESREGKPVVEW